MISLVSESYNGSPISLRASDGWVNATQMAKPFGKRASEFLRLPATESFLAALANDAEVKRENPTSLFATVRGNFTDSRQQGTWMHPDLALEFARWLSPEFAIWTNRVIRKVLSGQSLDESVPQAISEKLSHVIDMVAALAEAHVRLERRVGDIEEYLTRPRRARLEKPKSSVPRLPTGRRDTHPAKLVLAVLEAGGAYTVEQMATRLGWSLRTTERKLHQLRSDGTASWSRNGFAISQAKEAAP